MMFATDRDMMVYEPTLFRDVGWVGQRLVGGSGMVTGTMLILTASDVNFEEARLAGGHVVVVGGIPYEVVERLSPTSATISRLRESADGPLIKPSIHFNGSLEIVSFRPQLAMVHRQLLRMLGIEPDGDPPEGSATESDIVNPGSLKEAEALGALHLVFSAASASTGPDSPLGLRAEHYRRLFALERQRVIVRFDLDKDGVAETVRRLNVIQLERV